MHYNNTSRTNFLRARSLIDKINENSDTLSQIANFFVILKAEGVRTFSTKAKCLRFHGKCLRFHGKRER